MIYDSLKAMFELGRPIVEDSKNPYLHFAYKNKLDNYRLITSGELLVRGKNLDIPTYAIQFILFHSEVLMIANIIADKVLSITLRTIGQEKEFMKVGTTKSMFYGLGKLDNNFKYGTPLLLVEGHLDRDVMATIYPYTLGIMTSHLSKSQIELLTSLTDKFMLMFDNDEAGIKGQQMAKYQLKGYKVMEIKHEVDLKDAGDIAKLDITDHIRALNTIEYYGLQIALF